MWEESWKQVFLFADSCTRATKKNMKDEEKFLKMMEYSGICIKRTHHKADISVRRTVNQGTDDLCQSNSYKAVSLKRTHIKRTLR